MLFTATASLLLRLVHDFSIGLAREKTKKKKKQTKFQAMYMVYWEPIWSNALIILKKNETIILKKKKTYNLGIFKSSMNHIKQSYYNKIAWNINKNIYIL